jgi:hypothetical protein
MNKRKLWLSATGLAILLVAGGALSVTRSTDIGSGINNTMHPVMRYGGPIEKTLRIVPPVHEAIWPTLPFFG